MICITGKELKSVHLCQTTFNLQPVNWEAGGECKVSRLFSSVAANMIANYTDIVTFANPEYLYLQKCT